MFGLKKEIKSLAALNNINGSDITAEQLQAVNEEFQSNGLIGIEATIIGTVNSLKQELIDANAANLTATESLEAANNRISELEASLNAANEKLKNTPAAVVDETEVEGDKIEQEDDFKSTSIADEIKKNYNL